MAFGNSLHCKREINTREIYIQQKRTIQSRTNTHTHTHCRCVLISYTYIRNHWPILVTWRDEFSLKYFLDARKLFVYMMVALRAAFCSDFAYSKFFNDGLKAQFANVEGQRIDKLKVCARFLMNTIKKV